jgi:hypothetical protein
VGLVEKNVDSEETVVAVDSSQVIYDADMILRLGEKIWDRTMSDNIKYLQL